MPRNSDDLPTLVARAGPLNGQRWILAESLTIGREVTCNVVIPDRQVSRVHARLSLTAEGVLLEDLGSKNGTHRNGQPLQEPVLLEDGDTLQIALAQQFIFACSDATVELDGGLPQPLAAMPLASAARPRLELDERAHRVFILGRELLPPLSAAQFQLLTLLHSRPGQIVPRADLVDAVWAEDDAAGVSEQALDALIRRLRDRIAALDPTHNYIVTVRGHGIRLDNPA